jgi:capsular polysaccharide biosynthesis protein
VQQVQQVQLQKGEEAKPYVSIEPAAKTAEMFSGISAASLSAVKKVDGVLIVTSQGPDKTAIKENVEATIKLVEERHAKIFNALSSSGVKSVLPTEMIGTVVVTNHPIKPKRGLILAVAGVLGLMLGIFIALIRRAAKNRKEVVNL